MTLQHTSIEQFADDNILMIICHDYCSAIGVQCCACACQFKRCRAATIVPLSALPFAATAAAAAAAATVAKGLFTVVLLQFLPTVCVCVVRDHGEACIQ